MKTNNTPSETAMAAARAIHDRRNPSFSKLAIPDAIFREYLADAEVALACFSAERAKVEAENHKADIGNQILKEMVLSQDAELKSAKAGQSRLEAALTAALAKIAEIEKREWNFDSLQDLYNGDGAPLVDFLVDHMLSVFNKALGGKGWTAYESDGGLDDAIGYEINALLEKNQAIDEWDHRPLGPLLLDLIRLTDNESAKGKFRVTLDYDNYQDGGRVLNGDEKIIGECYESREGNTDEDGPNAQLVSAIISAVDASRETPFVDQGEPGPGVV